MLRKCLLVLSNPFFNEFYEVLAEIVNGRECVTTHVRTYQQRLFQDGDILNYRSYSPFDYIFGVAGTDEKSKSVDAFMPEVGIQFIDDDNIEFNKEQVSACFNDDLDYLYGLFVAQGINSIVTIYFDDK